MSAHLTSESAPERAQEPAVDIVTGREGASDGYTLLYFTAPKEYAEVAVTLDGEAL